MPSNWGAEHAARFARLTELEYRMSSVLLRAQIEGWDARRHQAELHAATLPWPGQAKRIRYEASIYRPCEALRPSPACPMESLAEPEIRREQNGDDDIPF